MREYWASEGDDVAHDQGEEMVFYDLGKHGLSHIRWMQLKRSFVMPTCNESARAIPVSTHPEVRGGVEQGHEQGVGPGEIHHGRRKHGNVEGARNAGG